MFIYFWLCRVFRVFTVVWAFFSCGEWWLLFVAVHGLLTVVASRAVKHQL